MVQRALEVQTLPGALPVQLVQPGSGECGVVGRLGRRCGQSVWHGALAAAGETSPSRLQVPHVFKHAPHCCCATAGKLTWVLDQASAASLRIPEWAEGNKVRIRGSSSAGCVGKLHVAERQCGSRIA